MATRSVFVVPILALGAVACGSPGDAVAPEPVLASARTAAVDVGEAARTRTPIKHVIVIVGENRTFDHVFATYKPRHARRRIWNLLSKGSSTRTARPARTTRARTQLSAVDTAARRLPGEPDAARAATRRCRRRWPAGRRTP